MSLEDLHEMRQPYVDKVVVHMSVGEGGRKLRNAEEIVEEITGQRTVRTQAKQTLPELGIRQGEPIGCKVTLRGDAAYDFLEEALSIPESIDRSSFDEVGNLSFGIEEHTDFEGMEYDPQIGIFGMDVTVAMARKGKRVERRRKMPRSLPDRQQLDPDDAAAFVEAEFGVDVA